MIPFGCEDKNRTPDLETRICPICGSEMDVFILRGRVMEDSICDCGYVIKEEEQIAAVFNGGKER